MKNLVSAVVGLSLLTSAVAFANPNTSASPSYGSATIAAGFTPDPIVVEVEAGGTYSVHENAAMRAEGCIGDIQASNPDYRITYTGGNTPLTIAFIADRTGADTSLVISDPEGDWLCVDDADAAHLDPVGTIAEPLVGTYEIWVGTVGSTPNTDGKLIITEMMQEVVRRLENK